jgi:hypothetical protein
MKRREQWRLVLDAEVKRWSAKSHAELIAELPDVQAYAVESEGRKHQVEVRILENTERYIHVVISVDDGTLPASLRPLSSSFIREK